LIDTEQQRPSPNYARLQEFQDKFEALVETYDWVDGLVCAIIFDNTDVAHSALIYIECGCEGCV
jgi:hypothetical protein